MYDKKYNDDNQDTTAKNNINNAITDHMIHNSSLIHVHMTLNYYMH